MKFTDNVSRPSAQRIFIDNFRWTWAHRSFQYKSAVLCTAIGIFLSVAAALSAQEPDLVTCLSGMLSIIGLVALWQDHRHILAEAQEFSIAPLTVDTHRKVVELAHAYGYHAGLFENRTILFPVEANRFIRAGGLNKKQVMLETKCFQICQEEFCRQAFEHFRRHARVVWNDSKVRLNTDPHRFKTDPEPIKLQKTTYFDYLATAFYSQRLWKYKNKVEYNGIDLMLGSNCLLPLTMVRTAHHVGVNTLLLTSNKQLLIQETRARGAVGRYVPSGSGSLDLKDIDVRCFGQTLLNGALREFCEETGWDELASRRKNMQVSSEMQHYPLGMVLDASRGLVTDFFFLSVADHDTHTDYLDQYRQGKVKVDDFEMPTFNAVTWIDCSACEKYEDWQQHLRKLVNNYRTSDPILAVHIQLFEELLQDIESTSQHPLWKVLLGDPNRAYLNAGY